MRIAIDIDHCIEQDTNVVNRLCQENDVYFITTKRLSYPERVEQLSKLNISNYKDIIIVEGHTKQEVGYNKALWIRDHGIDMFIEDNIIALEYTNVYSKDTLCLVVVSYGKI